MQASQTVQACASQRFTFTKGILMQQLNHTVQTWCGPRQAMALQPLLAELTSAFGEMQQALKGHLARELKGQRSK